MTRHSDGSAGDADYGHIGEGYALIRQPDERIAREYHAALGDASSVINVGAGAGSYEPLDRRVIAVEPSASMRAQRPARLIPAINTTADALPFDDNSFDAAMASVTVHQWPDLAAGLGEMRRVAGDAVVILTFDPIPPVHWWLIDYVPELFEIEAQRMPPLSSIAARIGSRTETRTILIPADCTDGFGQAFFARPESLLDPAVRRAMSAWSFVDEAIIARFESALSRDLASGEWDRQFGEFRELTEFDGGLRLVVGHP